MTRLKLRVINWCLKHLAKSITDKDVIPFERLNGNEKDALTFNAENMVTIPLWGRLLDEMDNHSREMMFAKSKNEFDMIFGKACLYVVDIMRRKVNKLAVMNKIKPNNPRNNKKK